MTVDVRGINAEPVSGWLAERVELTAPLSFELIAGGHSNLTYHVRDADGRRWVLRRPPLGHVLATAHDMAREAGIISALAGTDVPVPPVVGICTDETVNGAPFFVMDFVEGRVLRNPVDAAAVDLDLRPAISANLIDVLTSIHSVDVDEVGLGDLGRRDGYIERQINRWQGQLEKSLRPELPEVGDLAAELLGRIPDQGPATIVHGDFRLDNCIIGDDGAVAAVLDWEICTLGDPLADLGLLLVYWGDPDNRGSLLIEPPTMVEGFARPAELVERYALLSGRDVSKLDFYVAFGYWKLFCIVAGVYKRYVEGAMGGEGGEGAFKPFLDYLGGLADSARAAASRLR